MNVLRVLLHLALGAACLFAGVAALKGEAIPRYLACALLAAALGYIVEGFASVVEHPR